ncbi:hypothetical protein A6R68_19636, partial [Neotoma lepida]
MLKGALFKPDMSQSNAPTSAKKRHESRLETHSRTGLALLPASSGLGQGNDEACRLQKKSWGCPPPEKTT